MVPIKHDPARPVLDLDVTWRLKSLVMESLLPEPVVQTLTALVKHVHEGLQARAHNVEKAIAADPSGLDHGFVVGGMTRGIIGDLIDTAGIAGVQTEDLGNGGREIRVLHDGEFIPFRWRKATRRNWGTMDVIVNSDSFLTKTAKPMDLFEYAGMTSRAPDDGEWYWVLAHILDPITGCLAEVTAARIVGTVNEHSPFRLRLDNHVAIPLEEPAPPSFPGKHEDLDLDDERPDESEGDGDADEGVA
jgi:hypothetical protein